MLLGNFSIKDIEIASREMHDESNINFTPIKTIDLPLKRVQALQCSLCSFLSLEFSEMIQHYHINHSNNEDQIELPFQENNSFENDTTVGRLSDTEVSMYTCSLCFKSYEDLNKLSSHIKTEHNAVEKGNDTEVKRQKRKVKDRLKKTKRKTTTCVQCDICNKVYSSTQSIARHIASVHMNEKPFKCSDCEYSAYSKFSLKLHIRHHTGEKPLACDQCSYCTGDHNALRRHKVCHENEKPHKCPKCLFETKHKLALRRHLKHQHIDLILL